MRTIEKPPEHTRLGEFLSKKGYISERQVLWALEEQKKNGKRLGEILSTLKLVSDDLIAQSLASIRNIPYATPHLMTIDSDLFMIVPEWLARKHLSVPVGIKDKELKVAMADPLNYESLNDLRFYAGMAIFPLIVSW